MYIYLWVLICVCTLYTIHNIWSICPDNLYMLNDIFKNLYCLYVGWQQCPLELAVSLVASMHASCAHGPRFSSQQKLHYLAIAQCCDEQTEQPLRQQWLPLAANITVVCNGMCCTICTFTQLKLSCATLSQSFTGVLHKDFFLIMSIMSIPTVIFSIN